MSTQRQNPIRRPDASRCYLTGVQFALSDGFVLNRRAARELATELADRVAKLRRIIEQLAPLDDAPPAEEYRRAPRAERTQKRHRLICKAVAEALDSGYPEIDLFMPWPEYRAQVRASTLAKLRELAPAAPGQQQPGDHVALHTDQIARDALHIVDPEQKLLISTRDAIATAARTKHRDLDARGLAELISQAAAHSGDEDQRLGIRAKHMVDLRRVLGAVRSSTDSGTATGTDDQHAEVP